MTKTLQQRIEGLERLFPFEIIQGDANHRLNPGSNLCLNSTEAWLVSQPYKSAHKLKSLAPEMMQIIREQQELLKQALHALVYLEPFHRDGGLIPINGMGYTLIKQTLEKAGM